MNFEEGENLIPGSQDKIKEYIERVKKGEDLDSLDLPPKMLEAVKHGIEQDNNIKEIKNVSPESEEISNEKIEARKVEDQVKIDNLRKQISDFYGDEQLLGIYNTMQNIAEGAKEGLQEDIERKIQKYVEEIESGKDENYVLQGIPENWKTIVKNRLEERKINYEALTPEEVLIKLAKYCDQYMSAPLEAVEDGTFAGLAKLKIEEGSVVLIRHAADKDHLIKKGKPASSQEMADSSLFSGGAHEAGAVHTSADVDNWKNQYDRYPIYGEFRIPVKDFLNLGKEGKIIIGNLGEAEIVLSGDVAKKYLTKITEKKY